VRGSGDTHVLGAFLRDGETSADQRNFRVFGPDETLSNGLKPSLSDRPPWEAATVRNDEFLAHGPRDGNAERHQCEG
jgi:xylulose-5-phosphate/fructose-6-phosphate phosphoketolase